MFVSRQMARPGRAVVRMVSRTPRRWMGAEPKVRPRQLYPTLDTFARRHIGPDDASVTAMLAELSPPAKTLDQFIRQVIPEDILSDRDLFKTSRHKFADGLRQAVHEPYGESAVLELGKLAATGRRATVSLLGTGYYGTHVPEVIKRNVLENPAWYTSYTPYQPEISQGRLESLLNFQTLVCDLTALPVSNASLLDEGTAAAEAMTLSLNTLASSRSQRPGRTFVVDHRLHPQTVNVLKSRAEGVGVRILMQDLSSGEAETVLDQLGDDLIGLMVQYPDTWGGVHDHRRLADYAHSKGVLLSVATDLLALTMLTPPGEWGADLAFGSAQRLGVPMGFGGPHAAFFAVREKHKRKMPGRLVGLSKDRLGNKALRLALQTREQHIRREKATSNVCTAQALLANMTAFFAIYHGPNGLRDIAERCNQGAKFVRFMAETAGFRVEYDQVGFDTVVIETGDATQALLRSAEKKYGFTLRRIGEQRVAISIDETTTEQQLQLVGELILEHGDGKREEAHKTAKYKMAEFFNSTGLQSKHAPAGFRRTSAYLTHAVFNTYHSETELMRYMYRLQSKDLSLVHSMIPLGSCTMKLNSATQMALISLPGFANLHPHITAWDQLDGYRLLIRSLRDQLAKITDMAWVSLQPNSGAQGEFAGLRVIRKYHESRGESGRDLCLIPVSAHGTNPASAAMAGMRVLPVKCEAGTGNLDMADLEAKCEAHTGKIGAIMVTYPSTFGVFEPGIKKVCEIVHAHGGQVYMDGANMNAQIGLCSPGEIGADVCHLNLHKTFCIPHGGGGPGVGPICVKEHLADFLPSAKVLHAEQENHNVSSAPYGSASILPISWAYNSLMGSRGLREATEIGLLNANYLLGKLSPHYKILYTNTHGRCAHEFILDVRPFHDSAGIEAIDIAKRLQDYGFHAPTMSWPVANTLMIEPTESEGKEELDRFVAALVSIRHEIAEVENGRVPREGNVLKMAPHPMADLIGGDGEAGSRWERPYTREQAAYPLPWLRQNKFWPTTARVDDKYGDLNLFCTCPPVEDTTGGTLA